MKRAIKISLISLAAGGLLAGLVFGLVAQLNQPFFSPPDQAREWARSNYEKIFLSATPTGGLPKLSSTPPLEVEVSRETGKVIVETKGPQGGSVDEWFEIFPADDAGEVALPTGNRLRLEAVGMVMPQDLADKEESGSMSDVTWLDPFTLAPLPEKQTRDWDSRRWVSGNTPKFFFRVSNEGGGQVRWLAANAFDDRTLIQAQSGSSYYTHEKAGQFAMDLEIWHQTPLRLAVNFSFGEPELQDLELRPGTEVQFGDDALVRVVDVAPEPFNSTGWHSGGSGSVAEHTTTFRFDATAPKSGRDRGRGVVFHVWPAHAERMIDFPIEKISGKGKVHYVNAWGNDGITSAAFPEESELVSVRVRRMPRLGRAVFLLPKTPRLPETDNLFEVPIARVEFHYDNHMVDLVMKGAAVQWSGGGRSRVPDVHFPLVLEDTTPAEVLRLNQTLAGRPLFFDRKNLEVSTENSGMLADLKNWWKRSKPGWLP